MEQRDRNQQIVIIKSLGQFMMAGFIAAANKYFNTPEGIPAEEYEQYARQFTKSALTAFLQSKQFTAAEVQAIDTIGTALALALMTPDMIDSLDPTPDLNDLADKLSQVWKDNQDLVMDLANFVYTQNTPQWFFLADTVQA